MMAVFVELLLLFQEREIREKTKLNPFVDCSFLVDEIYKRPVIIHSYPKELKPFHVRLNDDGKTVAAFDIIVPNVSRNFLNFLQKVKEP